MRLHAGRGNRPFVPGRAVCFGSFPLVRAQQLPADVIAERPDADGARHALEIEPPHHVEHPRIHDADIARAELVHRAVDHSRLHATADVIRRLQQRDPKALLFEQPRGIEPRQASAEDDDVGGLGGPHARAGPERECASAQSADEAAASDGF